jgi:uncharacterized repeat protein (TIGR03803 family)
MKRNSLSHLTRRMIARSCKTLSGVAILALFFVCPGQAQTLKTIYNFTGYPDGANPVWGPVFDVQGNLWGTTSVRPGYGGGTVYKLTPSENGWNESTVYSFGPGTIDVWGFILDGQGNLYNTTDQYQGSLFEITPAGVESTIYNFTGGADGGEPLFETLVRDALGNFYGTAAGGGAHNFGVVFEVTPSGTETVLYSFTGGADGATPSGGVVLDAEGNLYGTTGDGGRYNQGTVFKVTPGGIETVLHSFSGADSGDGKNPIGGLAADKHGHLYGATWNGGTAHAGTVFEVTSSGKYKVLYSFRGGANGAQPTGPLTLDAHGNLYGVTLSGAGTVYRVTRSGKQKVLWNFGNPSKQSKYPMPGLVWDAWGNLYGVTNGGSDVGYGTVFELTP